ncbi:hypothetical protein E4U30_004179 [Claviceps sp. LM220 group G6]|nr:hypothetical protein E4U30_004179 [Claviceps sp. LM220 group G6]
MLVRPRCVSLRRKLKSTVSGNGCDHSLSPGRRLVTLAIESSCDDTAVAVLSHTRRRTELLFNERICADNRAFKGVHPIISNDAHQSALAPLVQRALLALPDAGDSSSSPSSSSSSSPSPHICLTSSDGTLYKRRPDFVSVTRGPGILTNLSVGINMAKGLAVAWDVPLVGVHHMQAHALTPRLVAALRQEQPQSSSTSDDNVNTTHRDISPQFPFLTLLVSGGHTQLVHSASLTEHHVLATTIDHAIGNLLDQTARVILPPPILASSPDVMYGRLLESFAFNTTTTTTHPGPPPNYHDFFQPALSRMDEMTPVPTSYPWTLSLPFRDSRRLAFCFSSLHMQVHRIAEHIPPDDIPQRRCLAQHILRAAFQHLASRLVLALQDIPGLSRDVARTLVVSGGVASNQFLKHVLRETLSARGYPGVNILAPPVALCTDNAAMIAWAGMEMFEGGWVSDLGIRAVGKWPMSEGGRDAILGVEGWVRR